MYQMRNNNRKCIYLLDWYALWWNKSYLVLKYMGTPSLTTSCQALYWKLTQQLRPALWHMHCTNPQNICMLQCERNKPSTKIETNRWQSTFDKVIQNDLRKRPLSWGLEGASHSKRERNSLGSKNSIWKHLRKFLHMVQVVKDQCDWLEHTKEREMGSVRL